MTKASPLFLCVVLFAACSLYGCTNQKTVAFNAKMREMEERYVKLEEDYRAVAAVGEANRKKLNQVQAEKAELAKQVAELRVVVQERDQLRTQLTARTGERDAVQAQLVQFSNDLRSLVGRVEAAANSPTGPTLNAVPASRTSE